MPEQKSGWHRLMQDCRARMIVFGRDRRAALELLRQQRAERREYEFMPAAIEVLERPPAPFSRVLLWLIVLLAAIALLWACLARMDIIVNAHGVVVPKGRVKVIQPLESGIVTAIHVRDGQQVQKGDLLVSMDATDSLTEINTLEKELLIIHLTIGRLEAQLHDDPTRFIAPEGADSQDVHLYRRLLHQSLRARQERREAMGMEISRSDAELKSITSNVKRLQDALPIAGKLHAKKKKLSQKGLIPKAEFLKAQMEMNDTRQNLVTEKSRLNEVRASLAKAREENELVEVEYRRELLAQLTEARGRQENLQQQLARAENRQAHSELRSPAYGIVQQLSINTVGGVVTTAQPLMVIVPLDSGLEIEAKVLDRDIGLLASDQQVSVKVTAYPFMRYGDLEGSIEWVAGDAVMDEQLGPCYPIRVAVLDHTLPNLVNGRTGTIAPGMTVTADVKVGTRRVIHYFIGPIMRYRDTSLREM